MANVSTIRFTHPALTDKEGNLRVFKLPAERVVCPECNGNGHHFRSDLDENKMVELIEADGDEDEMDHYRRGGYDQTCSECKGRNVIDQVNWDEFQKQFPKEAKKIYSWDSDVAEDAKYAASERAYCGGY
jgi:hypothetical protein